MYPILKGILHFHTVGLWLVSVSCRSPEACERNVDFKTLLFWFKTSEWHSPSSLIIWLLVDLHSLTESRSMFAEACDALLYPATATERSGAFFLCGQNYVCVISGVIQGSSSDHMRCERTSSVSWQTHLALPSLWLSIRMTSLLIRMLIKSTKG